METVITSEVKETIPLPAVKDIAHKTAKTLSYIKGGLIWFGKEWLTPADIKAKFKEARIEITDEEIQLILTELAFFLIIKQEHSTCPITEVKYSDY